MRSTGAALKKWPWIDLLLRLIDGLIIHSSSPNSTRFQTQIRAAQSDPHLTNHSLLQISPERPGADIAGEIAAAFAAGAMVYRDEGKFDENVV